jgi:DNA invertase Pin-like site-specific DNA recombinase
MALTPTPLTQQLLIYIDGSTQIAIERQRDAMRLYAQGQALPRVPSDNFFEEASPGPMLDAALFRLSPGDVLLIPRLSSLGERPSKQEQTVRTLIAKGVQLHVLSLHGRIEPHLLGLTEVWSTAKAIEFQRDHMEQRMKRREQQIADEQQEFENALVARMSEKFGVKYFIENAAKPDEPNPTGQLIKSLREQRGLTQQQLADLAHTSKPQISRIEISGRGEALSRVMQVLKPNSSRVGDGGGGVAEGSTPTSGDTITTSMGA